MSFWLLTVAAGNLFVALLTELLPHGGGNAEDTSVSTGRFLLYAAMMFGVAIVFSLIAATYHYRDKAAAMGKLLFSKTQSPPRKTANLSCPAGIAPRGQKPSGSESVLRLTSRTVFLAR